eukprot:jgi/Ulvmu1/3328/UM155_0011.1
MIRYHRSCLGLSSLWRWYGSAFPRSLPLALTATVLAVCLSIYFEDDLRSAWPGVGVYLGFLLVVGFALLLRLDAGYRRFCDTTSHLQHFTGKLVEATSQALTCDLYSQRDCSQLQAQQSHARFSDTFIHLGSLLHAVGLACLRNDCNMENISVHNSCSPAPPVNLRASRMQHRSDDQHEGTNDVSSPTVRDSSAVLHDEKNAENTQLARSCCCFSCNCCNKAMRWLLPRKQGAINAALPLPVIAGMTQDEGTALGAQATVGQAAPALNIALHGCALSDGSYAPAPSQRSDTVHTWLQHHIAERLHSGRPGPHPPLLADVYTTLATAMTSFEHCRTAVETPPPFPWVQGTSVLLLMFAAFTPCAAAAHLHHPALAGALAFALVCGFGMLHDVARALEAPYRGDPNQVPLSQLQYRLNERLLAVALTRRPGAFTDDRQLLPPTFRPSGVGRDHSTHAPTSMSVGSVPPPLSLTGASERPPNLVSPGRTPAYPYAPGNPVHPVLSSTLEARLAHWGATQGGSAAGSLEAALARGPVGLGKATAEGMPSATTAPVSAPPPAGPTAVGGTTAAPLTGDSSHARGSAAEGATRHGRISNYYARVPRPVEGFSNVVRVPSAGSWPYAPPHDFTAAPSIDASGGIFPALAAPKVPYVPPATTTALATSAAPSKAVPLRRPYTVGDWTPSPPAESPPSASTPAAAASGNGNGGRSGGVSAVTAWTMPAGARSGRSGVARLPPIPASMSGGSGAADSGHIAGESALLDDARAVMAVTGAATRGSSSTPLADTSMRLRQYAGQASAMSSSSSSMMRPGTGPFASGRMTPEPGLPHIKEAAAAAAAAGSDPALSPPSSHGVAAGHAAALPPPAGAAAAPVATGGRAVSGSTATVSLPLRHESESSRRSMHAQEETTASWDTALVVGKMSARHSRPLRSARGAAAAALALAMTPRTARDSGGSGPSSARLTALPLPPHTTLSTVEEPVSRDPTALSHAASSRARSSVRQTPQGSQPPPSPGGSDNDGDSSDTSVYRSSSSHSSNHMYDAPVRAAIGAARGKHRRASSRASTPAMYELETVIGATATHGSQQGSLLQPLGGPPANMPAAGLPAAEAGAAAPRRSEGRQRGVRGAGRSERRAAPAATPLRPFSPPAAAAHAATDRISIGSGRRTGGTPAGSPAAAPASPAAAAGAAPAAASSFGQKQSASRAPSALAHSAAGGEEPARQGGQPGVRRHTLMSSALGLNTRDSIYCMGPESSTPTHRSQETSHRPSANHSNNGGDSGQLAAASSSHLSDPSQPSQPLAAPRTAWPPDRASSH